MRLVCLVVRGVFIYLRVRGESPRYRLEGDAMMVVRLGLTSEVLNTM